MNEPLLRSVLRLYALFAGSDGLHEEERKRIAIFLESHLSFSEVRQFLHLLDQWCLTCFPNLSNPEWVDKELQLIVSGIIRELNQAQRYYLFLELMELSMIDGKLSESEDSMLRQVAGRMGLPAEHVQMLRYFALGDGAFSGPQQNILLIHGMALPDFPESSQWVFPEFNGRLAVLKIPGLDSYFVQYQGKNEPLLNGLPLRTGISRIWAPGATLRQDGCQPVFYSYIQERFSLNASKPVIHFRAENLYYHFPDKRTGLKNIGISEKGGRMVAIMGGSGCGKSTLFNVLNGNEKPSSGRVLINGTDLHRDSEKLEGMIGYIPQDDLLNERLTVYQNLYYAARFSFGNLPEEEIRQRCNRVLDSLGLSATRAKEVGSPAKKTISGGQRKRLNIGLELIREPWILFVDEPTSGLSSSDSLRTMELLKNLALDGKLVFVIIHQPSEEIFRMFDRLLVMDAGGVPVFYGNPLEAVPYFRKQARLPALRNLAESADAAEIFQILESKLVEEDGSLSDERKFSPEDWEARFREEISTEENPAGPSAIPEPAVKPGFFSQMLLYLKRDLLAKLHDRQYLLINLLEAPFLALLLALVVRYAPGTGLSDQAYSFADNENIPAYFFMSVIVALFMGMSVSAEEIIRDRLLLKRERFLHLSRDAYLIAKIVLLFGLSLLHTLAFVLISDWVLEVSGTGMEFWLVLFACSAFANLLGLILSDTFRNAVVVYILIPLLLIPQIVLGGALIRYDRLSPVFQGHDKVPLIGDVMVARWAYEALMVAQFRNNPFQNQVFEVESEKEEAHYRRSAYLPALNQLLADINGPGDSSVQEQKQKREILFREIQLQLSSFGQTADSYRFLLQKRTLSPEEFRAVQKLFSSLLKHYNKLFLEKQIQLDAIFRNAGTDAQGRNRLLLVREEVENKQIARFLAEDFILQPRLEISPDGIIRKEKPVYRLPEPSASLDFRTHHFSAFKPLWGNFFPTETFNVFIIWIFSLMNFFLLRFRIIRKLFRIRD